MMAGEPGTSTKRADLEWRGVGWLLVLLRDMPDLLDREAEEGLRETVATFGLVAPDGSLTERGEEARRAALRLLAERQVSPARIEVLAGGDVARWAALADAATPGPWEYDPAVSEPEALRSIKAPSEDGWCVAVDLNDDDGAFIAEARTAVPALCAEVARLRAALAAVTEERDVLRSSGRVARLPGKPEPYSVDGLTTDARERVGYVAALVQASAYTCITGRPEDAARAFAGLLGAAGESEDGRRGAARALMHCALVLLGREVPTTTVEHDVGELQAEAEANERPSQFSEPVHAGGIRRALSVLAPHLPLPRVRR